MLLKSHQIIGELRPVLIQPIIGCKLKSHQIIGELRLKLEALAKPAIIEKSPDHW